MTEDETWQRLTHMSDAECMALLEWVIAPWTPVPDRLDVFSASTGRHATSDTTDPMIRWESGEAIHADIERLLNERLSVDFLDSRERKR